MEEKTMNIKILYKITEILKLDFDCNNEEIIIPLD